jgi:hypothetical protein
MENAVRGDTSGSGVLGKLILPVLSPGGLTGPAGGADVVRDGPLLLLPGSLAVGSQCAVGGDMAEYLADHGQHVRIFNRVVSVAAFAPGGHDVGQPQFRQVLARGGNAEPDPPGQGADVGLLMGHQPRQVEPGALPSRVNVAAAARS